MAADLAKRAVERFDGVGGVDDFADLRGEVEEGGELVPVGLPAAADGGVFGVVGGAEGFQRAPGGLFGGGGVDGLEVGGDLLAFLPVDEFEAVAQLVDDAALDPTLGKDRFEGLGEAAEAVDAADEDVLEPAVFELGGDGEPEARAFVFRGPHAEHFLLSFEVDGEGEVDGAVGDFALVADFHHDGVEVNDGVDALEAAVLPSLDLLDDGVGGVGDEGAGDLDLVDFKEVLLDLAHAQTARIEAHDALVEAVELAPVLGHEGGLKLAVAVGGTLMASLPSSLRRVLELWPLRALGGPSALLSGGL